MIVKEYNIFLNKEAESYLLSTITKEKDITGAKIKNILLTAKELIEQDKTKKSLLTKITKKLQRKKNQSPINLTIELLNKAFNFYTMTT